MVDAFKGTVSLNNVKSLQNTANIRTLSLVLSAIRALVLKLLKFMAISWLDLGFKIDLMKRSLIL